MTDITKEQLLLQKLYDCQDEMEKVLKDGKEDYHYKVISDLIKKLEIFLCDNQELM